MSKARCVESNEFKRLIAIAKTTTNAERNVANLYLLFASGLRAKEASLLRIKDLVNPYTGELLKVYTLQKWMTKTKVERPAYLVDEKAREVVANYLKYYEETWKAKGRPFSYELPLFPSQKGGHFHGSASIVRAINNIFRAAHIHEGRSHSGRVTVVTKFNRRHIPLGRTAKFVGHSSVKTTAGYDRVEQEELEDMGKKLI